MLLTCIVLLLCCVVLRCNVRFVGDVLRGVGCVVGVVMCCCGMHALCFVLCCADVLCLR